MRKCILIISLLILPVLLLGQDAKHLKRRVAVFDFEDKTSHQYRWWTGQPVGNGMADMLVTELVKSGDYVVIERQELEKLMQEQSLGMSGVVTEQSAAQVGKVLGVELAIFGSVTEFGHSEGGVGGNLPGRSLGIGIKSSKATVAIDIRFVDTTTGQILAAENIRREQAKRGVALSTKDFSFDNRHDFDDSIVGKATREAIDDIVNLLKESASSVPWQAKIIKGDGPIYINAGSQAGVEVGDVFVVYRPGEELIDPDTGISLGSTETKVGSIKVTNNAIGNGKAAECIAVDGQGFLRNDIVRLQ
ncbi:hypothetical protein JW935_03080 [candidate division KSB1 bacterium]|nr:hypothetical protein [candidate division KSB1 bacterium]